MGATILRQTASQYLRAVKAPKILAVASAVDLDFRYGCTPAWWQLWKGLHEAGCDLIVTPYRGRPVESPWWRTAPNPCYREGEAFAQVRDLVARLKGDRHIRRAESDPGDTDRWVREAIWRWVTPRWQRHIERILERERDVDAVVVFTVPMSHLRGIPTALRERFGVPVVFYDGDVPMSLPEFGGMDTGFNYYFGADPGEYDLVVSNSEGGLERLRELGARRAEAVFWGADPELFQPLPVEKETDVFFYGYGDKFRQEWTEVMVGEPSRRLPEVDFSLGGEDFRGDIGRARLVGNIPINVFCARDLGGADQPQRHAARARDRLRVVHLAAVRARDVRRDDRLQPARGDRALVRAGPRAAGRERRRRGDRRVPRAARRSGPRRGAGPRRPRAGARRAHVRAPRAAPARAARRRGSGGRSWLRSPRPPRARSTRG